MPQITISTETLVAAGIVAVAIVGWSFARQSDVVSSNSGGTSSTTTKKKGKKTKPKKGDEKVTTQATTPNPPIKSQPPPQQLAQKVEHRQAPSFAAVTASSGDTITPKSETAQATKPKTLAEKKATKPRKTKVDDMIPVEDRPSAPSRVMKIVSSPSSTDGSSLATPSSPLTEQHDALPTTATDDEEWDSPSQNIAAAATNVGREDIWEVPKKGYANVAKEGGWESIPVKSKKGPTSINRFSALSSTSTPATSGSSTPTRIQRKNANTAAKKAAAKEVEERDRLERLTKYRKEQEREKMAASSKNTKGPGSGKVLGGGMNASVDMNGKLIWE